MRQSIDLPSRSNKIVVQTQSLCSIMGVATLNLFLWLMICRQAVSTTITHRPKPVSSYSIHVSSPHNHDEQAQQEFSLNYHVQHHENYRQNNLHSHVDPGRIIFRTNILLASTKTKMFDDSRRITHEINSPGYDSSLTETELDVYPAEVTQLLEDSDLITSPLVSKSIWNQCDGMEFYYSDTRRKLAHTGISMTKQLFKAASSVIQRLPYKGLQGIYIVWKPESKTKQLLQDQQNQPTLPLLSDALQLQDSQGRVKEGAILVWVGQFQSSQGNLQDFHGAEFPIIKTTSIVPVSPPDLANLLLDSNRVKEYNKMSLGRTDQVVFHTAALTSSNKLWSQQRLTDDDDGEEGKIIRNLTQPPLSNKILEFVTCMYARPLRFEDDVGPGFSSTASKKRRDSIHAKTTTPVVNKKPTMSNPSLGYIVVSRAVNGGIWNTANSKENEHGIKDLQRSEIILSVNLLRDVPGQPNHTELTTISHVNVPSVPLMIATPVGIKGAVDFVKDLRKLK